MDSLVRISNIENITLTLKFIVSLHDLVHEVGSRLV